MRPAKPVIILAVFLAAFPLAASFAPASPDLSPSVGVSPAPCTLLPAPGSSGRGLVFDFEFLTENEQIEANVSDPAAVSASIVVVVRNNATAPLSVHLSATINLGGTVKLDPAQTPLLLYQATSNIVVSVTLPEKTTSDSMGYLKIDGVCDQNPTVTNSLQVRVTVKQWHRVQIEKFSISSGSPLEREMVQFGARVVNAGNGPSNFAASAMVDGKPLRIKIDGFTAPANYTISLASGRPFMIAANWQATYGHHNFVLTVTDTGAGATNGSEAMSKDTKVASVFVGLNYRDWIPFIYLTIIILIAAALLGYRYRRKLLPRLRRLRRILKRGEPGSEGDEGNEDDGYDDDDEYDDDYEDDDEQYDEEDEAAPPAKRPPAGKGATVPSKKQAPMKRPAAAALARPAAPATGAARPRMSPDLKKGKSSVKPAAGAGLIVVGDPDEDGRPAPKRGPEARPDEEE